MPGRVAKALLDLSDRFGVPTPDGVQVNRDSTQEELAQLVGASRETVNKALADFAARGWIQLSAKSVLVTDTRPAAQGEPGSPLARVQLPADSRPGRSSSPRSVQMPQLRRTEDSASRQSRWSTAA